MKKILAIAIAVVMISAICATVSFAAAEPALLITAETLASEKNVTKSGVSFELKDEGGEKFARFTAVDKDPHLYLAENNTTDTVNHFAVIKYRTTSGAATIDAYMAGAEPHTIFDPGIVNDGAWHITYGDLEKSGANWTGKFARLDPMNGGTLTEGDTMDIAWIALFSSEADANAYKGPSSGSSSEQPAPAVDQWLCGTEVSAEKAPDNGPTWWFNPLGEPDDRELKATFKATSSFSGIKFFAYCSPNPEIASFKVELISGGKTVFEKVIKTEGDKIYETDFGKVYEAGEYTLRFTSASGSGVANTDSWFVLGGVKGENADVTVDASAALNGPAAGVLPAIMLVGATNPGTADAAVIAIAAVACIALAGVVVAKKVK